MVTFYNAIYKMFDGLSELSHVELDYVIDSYLLWSYKTMKMRGIKVRSWKAWRRGYPSIVSLIPV